MTVRSMPRILKISLIIASGLLALLVLAALLLSYWLNTPAFKQTLADQASQATGFEVSIEGDLEFVFFLGQQIIASDVRFGIDGENIATVKTLGLDIELMPLLRKETRINRILIQEPLVTLARNTNGEFNFRRPQPDEGILSTLMLKRFTVVNGAVRFSDASTGSEYTARGCNIEAENLEGTASSLEEMLVNIGFTAELTCAELHHNSFIISDLNIASIGNKGSLILEPITMTIFGAVASASLHTNFTGQTPLHALNLYLPQFQIGEFLKDIGAEQAAEGTMDFTTTLTMQGSTVNALSESMSGQISLHGQQLLVYGVDIDEEISRFETSQNFNLVDVGAFFFAGPLGLVVTKGYDFANLLQGTETQSKIQALVSDWTVTTGVAQAKDVAMTTDANRLALHGGLDFHNRQFNDVTFALVDANGCANYVQVINGSFQNPEIDQPGIFRSLAGPVISLLEQGLELVSDEECEPFYTGSLTVSSSMPSL